MTTDEEKTKLAKLLKGLEVPDIRLTERCSDLVRNFQQKFGKEVEEEEKDEEMEIMEVHDNPYKVDEGLLDETDRKLKELLLEKKRIKKVFSESVESSGADPKRPWRTHSNKEKLLRIQNELKHHQDKASLMTFPLGEEEMRELIKECTEEGRNAPPVGPERLRNAVDAAKRSLPNLQSRKIDNSTATAIMPEAHVVDSPPAESGIACTDNVP